MLFLSGFKDLLETQDADEKAISVLTKLIIPLKNAIVFKFVYS